MTKITVDKTLIEQAIDAAFSPYCTQDLAILVPALRAALTEPAVEPVAWMLNGNFYEVQQCRLLGKNPGEVIPGQVPLFTSPPTEPAVEPASSIKVWVLVDKDGNPQKWRTPCFVGPESDTQLECFNRAQPDRAPHKSVMLAAPPPPAEVPLLTDDEIDRMLSIQVPGGSSARDWFLPHESEKGLENIRVVVQLMFQQAVRQKAGLP